MITLPLCGIILLVLLVVYLAKNTSRKPKNFPPGPPSLPLWGTYWLFLKENYFFPHLSIKKIADRYRTDLLGFQLGQNTFVACHSYETCKEMLTKEEFNGRVDSYAVRARGRGNLRGIFFVDGSFWHDQRRFSLRHLRDYGFGRRDFNIEEVTSHEITKLVQYLLTDPSENDQDVCTQKGIVRFPDVLYSYSLNSIHHSISSTCFDEHAELREVGRAAVRFLRSLDSTGCALGITSWIRYLAPDFFGYTSAIKDVQILLDFALKVIQEHQKTFVQDHPRDFIDEYLEQLQKFEESSENDTSFSINQLQYLVMDYMFPSPVGIGHTFNYLMGYFVHYPDIQEKMFAEIKSVIGTSRLAALDDRKNLPYVEAVLRESMRKDPIVPLGLSRRCTADTTFFDYTIPENTIMIPNIWAAHHDPKVWDRPELFLPERWLDDNGCILRKDLSIPFGAGKRLCAGETFARNTMFLFLAGLVQNFRFRMPAGHSLPDLNRNMSGLTVTLADFYVEAVPR